METAFTRRFICFLILASLLTGFGVTARSQPGPAPGPAGRKAVLVVHATRRGGVSQQIGDPIFRRILAGGLDAPIDYYAETLDLLLIKNPVYRDAVRQFLRAKYQGQAFDVLVAVGDESLGFLSTLRDDLSAGATPLVFAVPTMPVRPPLNSTGLLTAPHFTETLEGALALHPGTQVVTVITGASPLDRAYEAEARVEFAPLAQRVAINYLSALPVAEVLRQVAQTPRHGILFLTSMAEDSDGEAFPPLEIADRLSRAANAPLYSWIDLYMGHGIVGGRMASPEVQATRTAQLALRLLKGERPDTIPVARVDWTATQFDWAQLARWGIDEARLPAGSEVLFRPPSAWDQHAGLIAGAAAIAVLQLGFIVALLVQRAGRRRAEVALRESVTDYREAMERLSESQRQQERLAGRLIDAHESESTHIARELHDNINQQLAGLAIGLSGLRRRTDAGDAATSADIRLLQERTAAIVEEVRHISRGLHPGVLEHTGLVSSLAAHCRELERTTDLTVSFGADGDYEKLGSAARLCLFRVAQEGLRNVVSHAEAGTAIVTLSSTDGFTELSIADDGRGFDEPSVRRSGQGLGLVSMQERARLAGGGLQVVTAIGRGTTLRVKIPVRSQPTVSA